ncbi:MAG: hypothetical protein JXD21_06590 [Candidatus Omnitrophica bacterium]|nr:hypothetical protein [Candidatus Omnitrophota bacterium]
MKVDIQRQDKLQRILKIDVGKERVLEDKTRIYQEIGKDLNVPGFRKGTAPLDVLERNHGKVLREEFLKRMIPAYYQTMIRQEKIVPAGLPRIFDVDFKNDNLLFSVEVEVKPTFVLQEDTYRGLTVKDSPIEVSDDEWKKIWNNLHETVKKYTQQPLTEQQMVQWAGYKDEEALRQAATIELKAVKLRQRRQDMERQVIDVLLKKLPADIPQKVAEEHQNKLLHQELYNLQAQGVAPQEIEKHKQTLQEKIKPMAEDQVRLYYILEAIAEKEQLAVDSRNLYDVVMGYILAHAVF